MRRQVLQPFVARRGAIRLHHDHPRRTRGTNAEGDGHFVRIDVAPTAFRHKGVAQMRVMILEVFDHIGRQGVFGGGIRHHHLVTSEALRQEKRQMSTEGIGFVLNRHNDRHFGIDRTGRHADHSSLDGWLRQHACRLFIGTGNDGLESSAPQIDIEHHRYQQKQ